MRMPVFTWEYTQRSRGQLQMLFLSCQASCFWDKTPTAGKLSSKKVDVSVTLPAHSTKTRFVLLFFILLLFFFTFFYLLIFFVFTWVLGFKHGSSCLYYNYFVDWAVSSANLNAATSIHLHKTLSDMQPQATSSGHPSAFDKTWMTDSHLIPLCLPQ